MVTRRRALHVAGAGLFGFAGCSGLDRDGTSTGSPERATTSAPTTTTTSSATDRPTEPPEPTEEVEVQDEAPAWTRALGAPIWTAPVYADGFVVVGAGGILHGLDAASGETAWTLDSPALPERGVERIDATLAVDGETVYALVGVDFGFGGRDYTLLALRPDGHERWRYSSDVGRYHEVSGFGDGAIVLPTQDDVISPDGEHVIAIDIADGEERWRADTGDASDGAVGASVTTVEAGDSVVDCFDVKTGERRFRFAPDGDIEIRASAVGGNRAFVALHRYDGDGPTLYSLSSRDGADEWTLGGGITSLRYFDDLYVGGETIRRLSADGEERWRYDDGGLLADVPFDDDVLYTNSGSQIVAIHRRDGHERWVTEATELAIPRARGGDAVVSTDGEARAVFAHTVADGRERWRASVPEEHGPGPAAGGDGAYVVTRSGSVLKLPL